MAPAAGIGGAGPPAPGVAASKPRKYWSFRLGAPAAAEALRGLSLLEIGRPLAILRRARRPDLPELDFRRFGRRLFPPAQTRPPVRGLGPFSRGRSGDLQDRDRRMANSPAPADIDVLGI